MKFSSIGWLLKTLEDNGFQINKEIKERAYKIEQVITEDAWKDGYKKAHEDIVTNKLSTFEQYQKQ